MGMFYVLDEANQVVPSAPEKWVSFFLDTARRTVAKTKIGRSRVSTVFLGIDHSFGSSSPSLFETALFREGGVVDVVERYATWEQAEKGHRQACESLRSQRRW